MPWESFRFFIPPFCFTRHENLPMIESVCLKFGNGFEWMKTMRNFLEHVSQYCELEIKHQKFLISFCMRVSIAFFMYLKYLLWFGSIAIVPMSQKWNLSPFFSFVSTKNTQGNSSRKIWQDKWDTFRMDSLKTSKCFYHVRIFKLILSTLLFIMICYYIYLFCSLSSVDATKFPAAKCFLFHKRARNYKISIDFCKNKDLLWSFNSLGTSLSFIQVHIRTHTYS